MIGPATKQIQKFISAFIRVTGFNVAANANTTDCTVAIASVLTSAGDGSTSVPLQSLNSTNKTGIIVSSPDNRVEILDQTTSARIVHDWGGPSPSEVYARITESSGIWRLYYYYLRQGSEYSYTFPATKQIMFDFPYRYSFERFPSDGIVRIKTRTIDDDADIVVPKWVVEVRTAGTNTISDLSKTPDNPAILTLFINTSAYHSIGPNPPFTINGRKITWSPINAGFDISWTDLVIAHYTSIE